MALFSRECSKGAKAAPHHCPVKSVDIDVSELGACRTGKDTVWLGDPGSRAESIRLTVTSLLSELAHLSSPEAVALGLKPLG